MIASLVITGLILMAFYAGIFFGAWWVRRCDAFNRCDPFDDRPDFDPMPPPRPASLGTVVRLFSHDKVMP